MDIIGTESVGKHTVPASVGLAELMQGLTAFATDRGRGALAHSGGALVRWLASKEGGMHHTDTASLLPKDLRAHSSRKTRGGQTAKQAIRTLDIAALSYGVEIDTGKVRRAMMLYAASLIASEHSAYAAWESASNDGQTVTVDTESDAEMERSNPSSSWNILRAACGLPVVVKVTETETETATITLEDVREFIALAASRVDAETLASVQDALDDATSSLESQAETQPARKTA